jgi:hypothetical protein
VDTLVAIGDEPSLHCTTNASEAQRPI